MARVCWSYQAINDLRKHLELMMGARDARTAVAMDNRRGPLLIPVEYGATCGVKVYDPISV